MTQNPYLDEIRKAGCDEAQNWRSRAEEIGGDEDTEYTAEDVRETVNELERKVKDACNFRDEYVESLPELLTTLSDLASEWSERTRHTDKIEESFWSQMSYVAYEEQEKVQFVLEEYLL